MQIVYFGLAIANLLDHAELIELCDTEETRCHLVVKISHFLNCAASELLEKLEAIENRKRDCLLLLTSSTRVS